MTWAARFVRWVDQTGNFFANGDPDSTISARIGYHTRPEVKHPGRFWLWLRSVVDWSFMPWDGPFHCWQAYQYDRNERFRGVGIVSGLLMSAFVLLGCVAVVVVNRVWLRYPVLLFALFCYAPEVSGWMQAWLSLVRGLV
tara:strand:- start:13455 stop:13874 length:420 start_codon:yes stop_codon:yes gene_type:complete